MWHCIEHLHAVTYFDEGCRAANREAGLAGFWMGYFTSRAAPLGPVGPGVVEAVFFNFSPAMVRRAIPSAWSLADPSDLVDRRRRSAANALRRIVPEIGQAATEVVPVLAGCTARAPGEGRPLFSANRDLGVAADPVEVLWQLATTLREHRGDGHVAVLCAHGLSGLEAHQLIAAEHGTPPSLFRTSRGWSEDEWARSARGLVASGLLDADGRMTGEGARLRAAVEERTDALACSAYQHLEETGLARLVRVLRPPAVAVARSGVIPYPNPMGLPPLG